MRGFLLWLLSCIAAAMRGMETLVRQVQEQVREREHQIVYKEFEAAISTWEKRTGKVVERTFRELEEGEQGYSGKDWKNFAMFLGSREAMKWRRYGYSFEKATEEWRMLAIPEPDMFIEGEEKE